jgi:two-component system cell cycle response regulator
MAQQHKTWLIGALGLTEGELRVLGSMATLTRARAEGSYVVSAAQDVAGSDIIIVNADDGDAVIQWRTLAVRANPPVMVLYTKEPPTDPAQHYVLRPFGPAKLLAVLDGIAAKLTDAGQVWKKPSLAEATPAATPGASGAMRALVVDDSPTVCKQLELELRKLNVQADLAETGERGLELLARQKYDLIFLDLVLPGTDGYQVCKDIRKNSATRQTPVIMLTSKSSQFDRVRGSLVGCSAYLTKPVDYNTFHQVVGKYVAAGAVQ